MDALIENDSVAWLVASFLLFAPAAAVISFATPPDANAAATALLAANALFAWIAGYWLVYRGGLERLRTSGGG